MEKGLRKKDVDQVVKQIKQQCPGLSKEDTDGVAVFVRGIAKRINKSDKDNQKGGGSKTD